VGINADRWWIYCSTACQRAFLIIRLFSSSFKSSYFSSLVPINALPLDTSTREFGFVFRLQEMVLNGDVPRVWKVHEEYGREVIYRIIYNFTKSKKIYSFKLSLAINKSTSRVNLIQTFISFDQIYRKKHTNIHTCLERHSYLWYTSAFPLNFALASPLLMHSKNLKGTLK
jgi:hypothetical protein